MELQALQRTDEKAKGTPPRPAPVKQFSKEAKAALDLPADNLRVHYRENAADFNRSRSVIRPRASPPAPEGDAGAGRPNLTGLPLPLIQRAEQLSGVPLGDVRAHFNSLQPARLGASAFAAGPHIFLGSGQERHVGHELRHVVQQKKGIVRPQFVVRGVNINASPRLEREAGQWDGLLSPMLFSAGPHGVFAPGPEPDVAQLMAVAQCFDGKAFLKSTLWTILNVGAATAQGVARMVRTAKGMFITEMALSGVGAITDVINFCGSLVRMRGSFDCAHLAGILSTFTSLVASFVTNVQSIVAGAYGSADTASVTAANINNWGAPATALTSDLAGVVALYTSLRAANTANAESRTVFDMLATISDAIGQTLALISAAPGCVPVAYAAFSLLGCGILIRTIRYILTHFAPGQFGSEEQGSQRGFLGAISSGASLIGNGIYSGLAYIGQGMAAAGIALYNGFPAFMGGMAGDLPLPV